MMKYECLDCDNHFEAEEDKTKFLLTGDVMRASEKVVKCPLCGSIEVRGL
jgi:DNA-directed RNA polymerase subunit RPC12/RpoP